jgi:hypothetical protein
MLGRTINTYRCDSNSYKILNEYSILRKIHSAYSVEQHFDKDVIILISIHSIKKNVLEIPIDLRIRNVINPLIVISFLSFEYLTRLKELSYILNSPGCLFLRLPFTLPEFETAIDSSEIIPESAIQQLKSMYLEEKIKSLLASLKHGGKSDAVNKFLVPLRLTIINLINGNITEQVFLSHLKNMVHSDAYNKINKVIHEIKDSVIHSQNTNINSVYLSFFESMDLLFHNLRNVDNNLDLDEMLNSIERVSDFFYKAKEYNGE